MTTIHIDNNLEIEWGIYSSNGSAYCLGNNAIELWLITPSLKKEITAYSVKDVNKIKFGIDAKYLNQCGIYNLLLTVKDDNTDTVETTVLSAVEVFQTVSRDYVDNDCNVLSGDDVFMPCSILNTYAQNNKHTLLDVRSGYLVPDEEDLTDSDGQGTLKFKNRAYDSTSPDGKGYVILRKNVPLSRQLTQGNTIYEIRYDFTIDANFAINDGCILKFVGGSIGGTCTLTLNNVRIEGYANIGCPIIGCPSNVVIYTEWFNNGTELLQLIKNFCNSSVPLLSDRKRKIVVKKGEYTIYHPFEFINEKNLEIDFCGSTLIDMIDEYDTLRHKEMGMFAMQGSSNISIHDFVYRMGNKIHTYTAGSLFDIGGPHISTVTPLFNIELYNIEGESSLENDFSYIPFLLLGNAFNICIHDITWKGPVSSLINCEYSIGPMTRADVHTSFGGDFPYPDYYGLMPYNIVIYNIFGYNRPTSTYGYIRASGAYNVTIKNVYCWDCNEVIEIFQGDTGNVRAAMNIVVNNVNSYWSNEMTTPNYACVVNLTRKNPQSVATPNLKDSDVGMIVFRNCDFQSKNGVGDMTDYVIRVQGNSGSLVFENCRIRNANSTLGVRVEDIDDSQAFAHRVKFVECFFENCGRAIEATNVIVDIEGCKFETDNLSDYQIYNYILRARDGRNHAKVSDCLFICPGTLSSPWVYLNSDTGNPAKVSFDVDRNIFKNTSQSAYGIHGINAAFIHFHNNIGDYITPGTLDVNANNTQSHSISLNNREGCLLLIDSQGIHYYMTAGAQVTIKGAYFYGTKPITIYKDSSANLLLKHQDSSVIASARLYLYSLTDMSISGNKVIKLYPGNRFGDNPVRVTIEDLV